MVGISADSLASHRRFLEKLGGLPFPLLSDMERGAIAAYGVLNEKGTGARRSVFVIDGDGLLRYLNTKYEVSKPAHFEALVAALEELKKA